jgi:Right handed beta helix region
MRKLFAAIGRRRLVFAAVLVAIAGGIAAAALATHHGPTRTTASVALRPPAQPAAPAQTAPSRGAAGHRLRQHPAAKLKHHQPAPKPHPKRTSRSQAAARAAGAQHPHAIPASAMRPIQVPAPQITHVAYFVSPGGSDRNPGTSPQRPWRTVARVNRAHLMPGDGVLFQGGQRFSDEALKPSGSGARGAPMVFASYGSGQAAITQGVYFIDRGGLTFYNLTIGPEAGLQGGDEAGHTADNIAVQHCTIALSADNPAVGINANGDDWTIVDNTITEIGNSGMLLTGDSFLISGNTIQRTGLDPGIGYAKHGIYLKVSHALVVANTISEFSSDGVSARYRDSRITGNRISDGAIGIAWFQYDPSAGTSRWADNEISDTRAAGIYVSPSDQGGATRESFVITGNSISSGAASPRWLALNLQPTSGTYRVADNWR